MTADTRPKPLLRALTVAVVGVLLVGPVRDSTGAAVLTENLYVTDSANKRVFVLQTRWQGSMAATTSLLDTITGFKSPTDAAVGQGVALVVDGKVVRVIDTVSRTILGKVKTGKNTRYVTITPDGKYGLATQGKRFLKVIDVARRKVIAKIKTGKTPWRVRIDDNGKLGAVVNVGDDSVTVFDLDTVLARRAGRSGDAPGRATAGVRTVKNDVCGLSGGLDVARFTFGGTWAIWSCGESPTALASAGGAALVPQSAGQQLNISDDSAMPQEYDIPGRTTARNIAWNPDCGTDFLEDGVTGSEDTTAAGSGRAANEQVFNYDWTRERTQVLGPGTMANPFSLVNGTHLSLYHPKGIRKTMAGGWDAPTGTEIFAVASTLTGVPGVCDR